MPDIWRAATRSGFSRCSRNLAFRFSPRNFCRKTKPANGPSWRDFPSFSSISAASWRSRCCAKSGAGLKCTRYLSPTWLKRSMNCASASRNEAHGCSQRRWPDRTFARANAQVARVLGGLPRHLHHPGISGRHLYRAIELSHRPRTRPPRNRWQRLVRSRIGGSAFLETIQPARPWPETVGRAAGNNAQLHLRESFLVVQHVFYGRLLDHTATDVSRGRTESLRCLHRA